MKKNMHYLLIAIAIIFLVSQLAINFFGAKVGKKAPDFEVELIDGTLFKLSDLRGEYVLLDFWGSWCAPCRKANPELVKFYKKYKDKVTIVTIALEKSDRHWKKAAEQDSFTWKHQIVDINQLVMLSKLARAYGVTDIPAKFLINPEGELLGQLSFEEMEKILTE